MATYEKDSDTIGRMEIWRYAHTTESAGVATFANVTIPGVFGMLARVAWDNGDLDGTNTIAITDAYGNDVLVGTGASVDMSTFGQIFPEDGNGNAILVPVSGDLTVAIGGNSTNNAAVNVAVYIIRFPR